MRVRCLVAMTLVVAGCGDDGGNGSCASTELPAAGDPLGRASELPHDDCDPGGLAGFDPSGLWYITPEELGPFGGGTIRFSLECATGLTAIEGRLGSTVPLGHVTLSDDDLFWRQEFEFRDEPLRFIEATTICRLNADGTLTGVTDSCFVDEESGETECFGSERVTLSRFERLPGESESDGFTLVSEFAGDDWGDAFTANVRVADGIAYVVRTSDGLRIVDVSDPEAPEELGHYPADGEDYNDVKVVRGAGGEVYALCASNASGVDVIDVTDPARPEKVAFFAPNGDPSNGVHTLFTETIGDQTRAYLADGGSSFMAIFDVTDPSNPVSLGGFTASNMEWGFHDLYVSGGRAFINATVGGLLVVDTLTSPANPTLRGQFLPEDYPYLFSHSNWVTTVDGRTISVHGDEGYDAHLKIIDVDPASAEFMEQIGELSLRPEASIHNIMAFGDRAYAAHYQDGVRVFDLSDPTQPRLEAYFNTWDPDTAPGAVFEGAIGIDVDLAAGLVYVADTPRGLLILRPAN